MRNLAIASALALVAPLAAPQAQPVSQAPASPAAASPGPASQAGRTRTLMDPTESFGAIYGTRNLASRPQAQAREPGRQPAPAVAPGELLRLQNARRQPSVSPDAFAAYLRSDPLIARMLQVQGADAASLVVLAWNHVALDMTSIDHTTAGVAGVFEPTYAEQFGPPRSARAMAMVHLAMFEAANAIDPHYESYAAPGGTATLGEAILAGLPVGQPHPTRASASLAAAVSQAAFDTLASLYPRKASLLDASRLAIGIAVSAQEAAEAGDPAARLSLGEQVGAAAAAAVIAARRTDGSDFNARQQACLPGGALPVPLCWEGYFPAAIPVPASAAEWTADEIARNRLMLGANWNKVAPFVTAPGEFVTAAGLSLPGGVRRAPTAADLEADLAQTAHGPMIPDPHGASGPISSQYGVHDYGGFGAPPGFPLSVPPGQGKRSLTATRRTDEQTQWAEFWGYDATALLCAPPRLYNMVATSFLLQHMPPADGHQPVGVARFLALANVAMSDAAVVAWTAKYRYDVARPVTYIRNRDASSGDDLLWTPLGQVASNGAVTNVTPPFPAWPSGHAVFGGALFTTIARAAGVDKADSPFDFVSDEFNGTTLGADGRPRPTINAHYVSLAAAEWENAESRIWLGVHWQADADDGSALGDAIGEAVSSRILRPLAAVSTVSSAAGTD